ncbi:RimJ/RimL family protein N-acetyltransferase [Brevundimonas alba]|uniref:RimJ/RimL family protein N-acetyltransferase n=1 Tax=Brevundimonas alba TaxID=74314 RepID=A0A7X5YM31_9CAUL|nr:GNAT family protein [Brevundimonas alba]NJC42179.1 RimJ/RimL family protein N-acetyltransferase [Brevundimonas alba]
MKIDPVVLENRWVRLEPFAPELKEDVRAAISVDEAAWSIMVSTAHGRNFDPWWDGFIDRMATGRDTPYAVRRLSDGRIVGTSSLHDLFPTHRRVELGSTFYHPDARGGVVNPASKRLLLQHAFDSGIVRVEIITDGINQRSQAAIAKLGAVREGVLRRHKITHTGRVRDTVMFSITDEDWAAVRARLDARLADYA